MYCSMPPWNSVKEILRHRMILTYEAEAEGKTNDDVIQQILDYLPVP